MDRNQLRGHSIRYEVTRQYRLAKDTHRIIRYTRIDSGIGHYSIRIGERTFAFKSSAMQMKCPPVLGSLCGVMC